MLFQNINSQRHHIHSVFNLFVSFCHCRIFGIYSVKIQKFPDQRNFFCLGVSRIEKRQIFVDITLLEFYSARFQKFKAIDFVPNRNVDFFPKGKRIFVREGFLVEFFGKTRKVEILIILEITIFHRIVNRRFAHYNIGRIFDRIFDHFFKHLTINKVIRINKSDKFSLRLRNTYVSGMRLTACFRQSQNSYSGIFFGKRLQNFRGFIF